MASERGRHPLSHGEEVRAPARSARLLPRFYLNPKLRVTDASYLQLLLEERFAMAYPEQTAEMLRAAFRD